MLRELVLVALPAPLFAFAPGPDVPCMTIAHNDVDGDGYETIKDHQLMCVSHNVHTRLAQLGPRHTRGSHARLSVALPISGRLQVMLTATASVASTSTLATKLTSTRTR